MSNTAPGQEMARSQGTTIHDLAKETLLQIFETVRGSPSADAAPLLACANTCKHWSESALYLLYKTIVIRTDSRYEALHQLINNDGSSELSKVPRGRDLLRKNTSTVVVEGTDELSEIDLVLYFCAHEFPSLRKLTLINVDVNLDLPGEKLESHKEPMELTLDATYLNRHNLYQLATYFPMVHTLVVREPHSLAIARDVPENSSIVSRARQSSDRRPLTKLQLEKCPLDVLVFLSRALDVIYSVQELKEFHYVSREVGGRFRRRNAEKLEDEVNEPLLEFLRVLRDDKLETLRLSRYHYQVKVPPMNTFLGAFTIVISTNIQMMIVRR